MSKPDTSGSLAIAQRDARADEAAGLLLVIRRAGK